MNTLQALNKLHDTKKDLSFADLCRAINSPLNKSHENIKNIIKNCDDVDTLKISAIKFDGMNEFFTIEGRLIKLMGADEYFDFADEHDLT